MCKFAYLSLLMISVLLLGAGCAPPAAIFPSADLSPLQNTDDESRIAAWQAYAQGIEARTYVLTASSTVYLKVFRFDPESTAWKFAATNTRQSMDAWSRYAHESLFIANGVYFHEDNSPSGFLAISGQRVGRRQFDERKSGVIELAPEKRLIDTSVEAPLLASYFEAAQSYPYLVKDGQPAVGSDSGRRARRTFVGTDRGGQWYIGFVTEQEVSLYQLSRLLTAATDIVWDNVLNLDGGPSTGYTARRSDGRRETVEPFGGVPNVLIIESFVTSTLKL